MTKNESTIQLPKDIGLPLMKLEEEINYFQTTQSSMLNPITRADIAWLWEKMIRSYGHKFSSSYGYDDDGTWYERLRCLTPLEIQQGYTSAVEVFTPEERDKKEAWPPNLKEFRMHCLDAFQPYGIPRMEEAYCEAQMNLTSRTHSWSHPIVFYAMLLTGIKTIHEDFWSKQIALFKPFYLMLSRLYVDGFPIFMPTREQSQQMIAFYSHRQDAKIEVLQ